MLSKEEGGFGGGSDVKLYYCNYYIVSFSPFLSLSLFIG